MIYGIIIGLIIIIPILIGYYLDYRQDPNEFKFSIKKLGKGFFQIAIFLVIFYSVNSVYEYIIPVNKNHGIDFNREREKIGIPVIGEDWKIRDYQSDQFITFWWSPEIEYGHFKKKIEYGILGIERETDYFKNPDQKGMYAWSTYNYDDQSFKYYIEIPNEKTHTVLSTGKLKLEKPTKIVSVEKSDFEEYIRE